jgi:hypothetical protein
MLTTGCSFPTINIPLLKSHLWDIKNKSVNPEHHLRGFLQIFQETPVFKDAYTDLDDDMKHSLDVFIKGGSEKEVMAARDGNFVLPPSSAVKEHFRELKREVEGLFHHEERKKVVNGGDGKGKEMVKSVAPESKEGLPKIYEDATESRTMEVSLVFLIVQCLGPRMRVWSCQGL